MLNEKSINCAELCAKVMQQMISDGYSEKSVNHHIEPVYNQLIRYCDETSSGTYTISIGDSFLAKVDAKSYSSAHKHLIRNCIERLNQTIKGDVHWTPPKSPSKEYMSSCYDVIITQYEEHLVNTGKTVKNIRHHIHLLSKFLAHMEEIGITAISEISLEHIRQSFVESSDKANFSKIIKMFFRYAHKHKFIRNDISQWIPSPQRTKPIPSVYTVEEVERIVNSVDRNSCIGKRDYCIILLAAMFGIRSCDIVALKLEDIQREKGVIRIVQKKTAILVEFPLLNEVLEAIDDYLLNGRPNSDHSNIFLTEPRPITSILSTQRIYNIVSNAIKKSGVDSSSRRCGAHALRSSLASNLLSEGKSYSEIQQVLGQTSPDVARHYVRVETDRLRECAVEVPTLPKELTNLMEERGF